MFITYCALLIPCFALNKLTQMLKAFLFGGVTSATKSKSECAKRTT